MEIRQGVKWDCDCWVRYPNEMHKRKNSWRCVDKYYCVRDLVEPLTNCYNQKTHCKRKEKEKMEALKKCPFCGGTAKFRTTSIGTSGGIGIYFKVGCGQCGTSSPKEHAMTVELSETGELEVRNDEREAAVFEWNKRAETNTTTDPSNDPNSDPNTDPSGGNSDPSDPNSDPNGNDPNSDPNSDPNNDPTGDP